jgi:hypothetical protein
MFGGKTHDHTKVRKCMDYHCCTLPGGIRVIVFVFSQGKHYGIDDRQRWRGTRLGKSLIDRVMIKICGGKWTHKRP